MKSFEIYILLAKKKVIDQLTIPINQREMALKFPIHGKWFILSDALGTTN